MTSEEPTPDEICEIYFHINVVSWALTVPCLALWSGLLAKMLRSKNRDKFPRLMIISILMIISMIGSIIGWQIAYTFQDRY